ncbi:MAG TPA: signal peptidase I [Elusimicrobiales bacterium]|nr:signal peptidase I [Elusimicrobiales bacterium]
MEEKLFWIGILMGAHLFLTQHFRDKGKFGAGSRFTRAWHSVFFGIVGFVGMVLLTVSLDNRRGDVVTAVLFTGRQLVYGLIAALGGAAYGWFKSPDKKEEVKDGAPQVIKEDMEWSETVFSAVLLASVVMYLFVQAFKIPSGSMEKTFLVGDHLFVNKIIYGVRVPYTKKKVLKFFKVQRGDIVVFQFPSTDPREFQCGGIQYGKDFIKRVVGMPGDTVQLRDGRLFVNGVQAAEDYTQNVDQFRYPSGTNNTSPADYQKYWETRMLGKMFTDYIRDNFGPVTVPPGFYMVMGDNRDRSCDSRYWGPVPESLIKGKAWFTYWPPGRIGFPQ